MPRSRLWLALLVATSWPLSCCCDEPECGDDVRDPGELCFAEDRVALELELETPLALRAGRFDGDDHTDLIVLGIAVEGVTGRMLRGDGDGGLRDARPVQVFGCSAYPITGDVDGDDRLDLVFATCTNGLLVFRASDEGFAAPVEIPVGVAVRQATVTDVDGDGRSDLLVLGIDAAGVPNLSFAQGLADGSFAPAFLTPQPIPALATFVPDLMAAARIERDGGFDVIIAQAGRSGAFARTRFIGLAAFAPPEQLVIDRSPAGLALRDLDNDDRLDLLTSDRARGELAGLLATDAGFGEISGTELGDEWQSFALGQLDDDGWLDLAVVHEDRVDLLRGVGDGSFAEGASLSFPAPVVELALFDLNSDGRDDLIAGTFAAKAPLTIALSGP